MITARTIPVRPALASLGLFPVLVLVVAIWSLQGGGSASADDTPTATATRGDIVDSVGGVGRIVQANAARPIATPAPAAGTATGSSAPAEAPPDAVFPRASGRLARYVVAPGDLVVAGQPLAVLEDGGAAAAGVQQARNDLSTALVELRQKRNERSADGGSGDLPGGRRRAATQ